MLYYKVQARKNPQDKSVKYYAQLTTPTVVRISQLAEEISEKCTINPADVKGCLVALETAITKHLQNGCSVRLGDLGSFHCTVTSSGTAKKEDFKSAYIKRIRPRFTPASSMKNKFLKTNPDIEFKLVTTASATTAA